MQSVVCSRQYLSLALLTLHSSLASLSSPRLRNNLAMQAMDDDRIHFSDGIVRHF